MVPARAGSKGIRNKNLRRVGGMSLVARSLKFGMNHSRIGPTILSSDSKKILRTPLRELGISFPPGIKTGEFAEVQSKVWIHLREPSQATDSSPLGPLIAEINSGLRVEDLPTSHTVLLQPTSPFRSMDDSHHLIRLLEIMGPRDSAVSVVRVADSHPARMYFPRMDGGSERRLERFPQFEGQEFTPRQSLPILYLRDGGFYVIGHDLAIAGKQLGTRPFFFEREAPYTVNIDSMEDLEEARRIARKFNL